jgi:LPS-assembly lipoprotein
VNEPRRFGRRAALAAMAALIAPGVVPLAGCGFALRQPARVSFGSIALTGFAGRSPMADELRRVLAAQTRVVEDPAQAEVVLQAIEDRRDRVVVASTAFAQVREIQLRLRFDFRVQTAAGRELLPRVQMSLARDLTYTETAALGKEYEEAEAFRAMQSDAVDQVLRRLASIRL